MLLLAGTRFSSIPERIHCGVGGKLLSAGLGMRHVDMSRYPFTSDIQTPATVKAAKGELSVGRFERNIVSTGCDLRRAL